MPVVLAAKPHFIPRRLYLRLIHFLRARFCPFPQSSVLHCSASRHTVPGHQLLEAAIFSGDFPSHLSIQRDLLGLFTAAERRGSLANRALWLYRGLFTWSMKALWSANPPPPSRKAGKDSKKYLFFLCTTDFSVLPLPYRKFLLNTIKPPPCLAWILVLNGNCIHFPQNQHRKRRIFQVVSVLLLH